MNQKPFLKSRIIWMGIAAIVMAIIQYLIDQQFEVANVTLFVTGLALIIARTVQKNFDVSQWGKGVNWVAIIAGIVSVAELIQAQGGIDWKNPWSLIIAILTIFFGRTTTKSIKS